MSEKTFRASSAVKAPAEPRAAFVAVWAIHHVLEAVLCRQKASVDLELNQ